MAHPNFSMLLTDTTSGRPVVSCSYKNLSSNKHTGTYVKKGAY